MLRASVLRGATRRAAAAAGGSHASAAVASRSLLPRSAASASHLLLQLPASLPLPLRRALSISGRSVVTVNLEQPSFAPKHAAASQQPLPPLSSSSSPSRSPDSSAASVVEPSLSPLSLGSGLGSSIRPLLSASQRLLLSEIKVHVGDARDLLLTRVGVSAEDARWLRVALESADDLFLLCVAGEYNAGKSSLLNAMLGSEVCQTGVLPTTELITLLRSGAGSATERVRESEHVLSVLLPSDQAPMLRDTTLCDTPGTNALLRSHELLTRNFLPRTDLVLFLTSVDRPFSESEVQLLRAIEQWRKKVVVVVNKIDLLRSEADRAKIVSYVRSHAAQVLRDDSVCVFPLSADQGLRAKLALQQASEKDVVSLAEHRAQLAASGLPALEEFIFRSLSASAKVRMKLSTPLSVAQRIVDRAQAGLQGRRQAWASVDRALLRRLHAAREDLVQRFEKDAALQQLKLATLFDGVKASSDAFVSQQLRLSNARSLLDTSGLRRRYEESVYGGLRERVESVLSQGFDYLREDSARHVASMQSMLAARMDEIRNERAARGAEAAALANGGSSSATGGAAELAALSDDSVSSTLALSEQLQGSHSAFVSLQRDAHPLLVAHEQGEKLASEAKSGLVNAALLEAGSLSLGGLLGLQAGLFGTAGAAGAAGALALPAYLAAGGWIVLGVAGVYALPHVRGRMQKQLREHIDRTARQLATLFDSALSAQREAVLRRVDQGLARYEAYVRAEGEGIEEALRCLVELQQRQETLKQRILEHTQTTGEENAPKVQQSGVERAASAMSSSSSKNVSPTSSPSASSPPALDQAPVETISIEQAAREQVRAANETKI